MIYLLQKLVDGFMNITRHQQQSEVGRRLRHESGTETLSVILQCPICTILIMPMATISGMAQTPLEGKAPRAKAREVISMVPGVGVACLTQMAKELRPLEKAKRRNGSSLGLQETKTP